MIQNLEILYLIIIKVNTVRRTHILKEFRWINNNIGIYFLPPKADLALRVSITTTLKGIRKAFGGRAQRVTQQITARSGRAARVDL